MVKTIFKAKTNEAYIIKILAELLSSNIRTGCFEISKSEIKLRMFDFHRKTLIDLKLIGEKFNVYKYSHSEDTLSVGVNLNHFFKMLRSIKKKDSLELHIEKDNPTELIITTIPKENTRKTKSGIKIQTIQNLDIEIPGGYTNPILITSCDLQKMCKDLNYIGGTNIEVFSKNKYIEFSANADDILKRTVCFGDEDSEDDEDSDSSNYSSTVEYKSNFTMEHFFRIHKITGLSSSILVYPSKMQLPLLFKSDIGSIGRISVFIKSKEMIEYENTVYGEYDNSY